VTAASGMSQVAAFTLPKLEIDGTAIQGFQALEIEARAMATSSGSQMPSSGHLY